VAFTDQKGGWIPLLIQITDVNLGKESSVPKYYKKEKPIKGNEGVNSLQCGGVGGIVLVKMINQGLTPLSTQVRQEKYYVTTVFYNIGSSLKKKMSVEEGRGGLKNWD